MGRSGEMMEALMVGYAQACITPPVGIRMLGYAVRTEPAQGIHDDLTARAVALSAGDTTVLVLTLDVCWLDLREVALLKGAIADEVGVSLDAILVNTSHTHAGPAVARLLPDTTIEAQYVNEMVQKAVGTAAAAMADRQPASLLVGSAPVDIGCNRRALEGPCLPEATAWRLSRPSAPDVVLFSIPIHGTTLSGSNCLISAEWSGAAVRALEEAVEGVRGVFLQGCAGDQNPYREKDSFAQVAEHGQTASIAVQEALEGAMQVSGLPLVNLAHDMQLPLAEGGTAPCPIHGIRLGEALLVGFGGEPFVEHALYTRSRSHAKSTMVLGYTDGSVGYLPTEVAYEQGGYEPNAYVYFSLGKPWDPSIEQVLRREIDAMLVALGDCW